MQAEATTNTKLDLGTLMTLLGRYYQIRDDYLDIVSPGSECSESTEYNDIDQGSFTLPIIHALAQQAEPRTTQFLSVLQSRSKDGGLSREAKKLVIRWLEEAGSLEYTRKTLGDLYLELREEVKRVEKQAGMKENWILRLILYRLQLEKAE